MVGSSTIFSFLAVAYIDPGTGSLLLKSLFSVGLGVVWLREQLASTQAIGGIIAIAGVVLIAFQPGDYLRLGSSQTHFESRTISKNPPLSGSV